MFLSSTGQQSKSLYVPPSHHAMNFTQKFAIRAISVADWYEECLCALVLQAKINNSVKNRHTAFEVGVSQDHPDLEQGRGFGLDGE